MIQYRKGKLIVRIKSADILLENSIFDKMDPAITLTYTDAAGKPRKFKTRVAEDAGQHPKWTDAVFEMPIVPDDVSIANGLHMQKDIMIRVWESNQLTASTPIGFACIKPSQLCFNGGSERDFAVYLDGKKTADVRIASRFTDQQAVKQLKQMSHDIEELQANLAEAQSVLEDLQSESQVAKDLAPGARYALDLNGAEGLTISTENDYAMSGEWVNSLCVRDNGKYCSNFEEDTLSVTYSFANPIHISGFALKSANDIPARDPRKWTFRAALADEMASRPAEEMLEDNDYVQEFECAPFPDRFAVQSFDLKNRLLVNSVTFQFRKDFDDWSAEAAGEHAGCPMFQLSELRILV